LNTDTYGRLPDEPLFTELIVQGVEPRRGGAFSGRHHSLQDRSRRARTGAVWF
jgi:hypothetical protein